VLLEQVRLWLPQSQQSRSSTVPATHTPWPRQALQEPQAQEDVQVRLRVPQLPQASDWLLPGLQTP